MSKTDTAKIKKLRAKIKADRDAAFGAALALADRASDPTTAADLEFALTRTEQLDERLDRLPKPPKIEVVEPDLYRPGGDHSYFRDLVATVAPYPVRHVDPISAADRLQRHQRFEEVRATGRAGAQQRALQRRGVETRSAADGLQARAVSTSTAAGFAPPRWLVEKFASVPRAASPLRSTLPGMPLPDGCLELVVPRFTAMGGVVAQNGENVEPGGSDIDATATTSDLVVPISTLAAIGLISQQLADRSDMDQVIAKDLAESYCASLEQQLVSGTGSNGQLTGLLNVAGISTVTYTSTSPSTAGFVTNCGAAAAAVSNARLRPPSCLVMRGGRYFWAAAQPDGSANVSTERVGTGMIAADPDIGMYGPIAGLPVIVDDALPANLGAGTNQDVVLALRTEDMLVCESEPRFIVEPDTSGGATALTVAISAHVYVAALLGRYPTSIAQLIGTGLVVAAGW